MKQALYVHIPVCLSHSVTRRVYTATELVEVHPVSICVFEQALVDPHAWPCISGRPLQIQPHSQTHHRGSRLKNPFPLMTYVEAGFQALILIDFVDSVRSN